MGSQHAGMQHAGMQAAGMQHAGMQAASMQHARQELPHASQERSLAIANVEYEYGGRHGEAAVKIQSTFRGGQVRDALADAPENKLSAGTYADVC